ncbi:uncharacterized protein LOC121387678 [Gigantopelta aegis]|uniref:uncharacterized protein LOC121387678 n=1 Tax=Gigantopelta aegis TaxID=1735272 RepID=UPI001B88819B|nr:uncharacterized protein LOC121387678 [Gigantopelta aegis]
MSHSSGIPKAHNACDKPDGAEVAKFKIGSDDEEEKNPADTRQPLLSDCKTHEDHEEESPLRRKDNVEKRQKEESPARAKDSVDVRYLASVSDGVMLPEDARTEPYHADDNAAVSTKPDTDPTQDGAMSSLADYHGDRPVMSTSRGIAIAEDDVDPSNKQQTAVVDNLAVEAPISPVVDQTKPTDDDRGAFRDSLPNPDSENTEGAVSHIPEPSCSVKPSPACAIEDPDEQTIERSERSPPGQTLTIHEVPNTNILVACLITVCFNLPLGVLAIYYSLMAAKAYRDGMRKKGARRARISMWISLLAIVVTVLIVMSVVLWMAMSKRKGKRQSSSRSTFSF